MRVCNNCSKVIEKLDSSDEEDADEHTSEFSQTQLDIGEPVSQSDVQSVHRRVPQLEVSFSDSPRYSHRFSSRDERLSDGSDPSAVLYSDNDTSSIVPRPLTKIRKHESQSRSPSRNRSSFRRHRSGTSLSIDQGKSNIMRIGQRKKSFSFSQRPGVVIPSIVSQVSMKPIDLNRASISHAKAFIKQSLQDYGMKANLEKWIKSIMPPLLECAANIDLDIKGGDNIDIRHYVKLKRIPGGSPKHTKYIDGIVFSQTLSFKSMPQTINNPRILLANALFENPRLHVTKLLEIAKQESSRFDTIVQRVAQLEPNIILSSGYVSRTIVKRFDQMGIAVVSDVKLSVLNRIARYTQATISTYETLSFNTVLGTCAKFEVKTYKYENVAKKYLFFSGIPKQLGCTIVLRGANMDVLAMVKTVVEFMVYVVFNLKLESSLLEDHYANVPTSPTQTLTFPTTAGSSVKSSQISNDLDPYLNDFSKYHTDSILSASPFVQFGYPYLLTMARGTEDKLVAMDQEKEVEKLKVQLRGMLTTLGVESNLQMLPEDHDTIQKMADFLYGRQYQQLYDLWSKQKRQWELAYSLNPFMFTPSSHQDIVLLYSVVCTETATPCVGPELLVIGFYDKTDVTLGQFIENVCMSSNTACQEACGKTLKDHSRNYVHGTGSISATISDYPCPLPGMQESILMWSTCKICNNSTPILPMSDASWKYSLGKFFEISFWSSEIHVKDNICPHDMFRDRVRFFGWHNMVVRCVYEKVDLYKVSVPTPQITWDPEREIKLKVQCYSKMLQKINRFFDSVAGRLSSVNIDGLAVEKIEDCQQRIIELLKRAEDEKSLVVNELNDFYVKTQPVSYLPLNGVLRSVQELVVNWDLEFAEFEKQFFPSEKDITRITAQHLKRIFEKTNDDLTDEKKTPSSPNIEPDEKSALLIDSKEILSPVISSVDGEGKHDGSPDPPSDMKDSNEVKAGSSSNTGVTNPSDITADPSKNEAPDDAQAVTASSDDGGIELKPINTSATNIVPSNSLSMKSSLDGNDAELSKETPDNKSEKAESILEPRFSTTPSVSSDTNLNKLALSKSSASKLSKKQGEDSGKSTNTNEVEIVKRPISSVQSSRKSSVVEESDRKKRIVSEESVSNDTIPEELNQRKVKPLSSGSKLSGQSTPKRRTSLEQSPKLSFPFHNIPDLAISDEKISPVSTRPGTRSSSPRRDTPNSRVQEVVSRVEARMESQRANKHERKPSHLSDLSFTDSIAEEKSLDDQKSVKETSVRSKSPVKNRVGYIPALKPSSIERKPSSNSPEKSNTFDKFRSRIPQMKIEDGNSNSSTSLAGPSSSFNFRRKFGGTSSDKISLPPPSLRQRFGTRLEHHLMFGKFGNNTNNNNQKVSVSSLASHFEQLSKDFEKERARERQMLAQTRFRAFPVASSKPIVEIFNTVKDAVEEASQSESSDNEEDDEQVKSFSKNEETKDNDVATERLSRKSSGLSNVDSRSLNKAVDKDQTNPSETTDVEEALPVTAGTELPAKHSEETFDELDDSLKDENVDGSLTRMPSNVSQPSIFTPAKEFQQTERQSLLQSLASFWADRSATGWQPLEYPLAPSEHIFVDSDVIVREDEPSSLIAFSLSSPDYLEKLHNMRTSHPLNTESSETPEMDTSDELETHMLKKTGIHLKYQFQEGSAKLSCKIFYAEQFDALRRQCNCDSAYIQSLSRCVKWDSSGGKSGSAFLKTLDDRLVVKQLSPAELDAFLKFAPSYFEFMAKAFFHELPSVLSKIFGFYQIQIRNPISNKTMKMDVLVMENLFYNKKTTRIFDLKGSMRNRHVQQTGRENEVLLDENMVEFIYESPLFVREHSKKLLRSSLWNDTLFLAKMNVMDYSLVIAIDTESHELVVGIIDFIRTFTWDKKLESWVKERGLVGGGVKEPTVVSPRLYKARFREAMERYVLMVPDCWYQEEEPR